MQYSCEISLRPNGKWQLKIYRSNGSYHLDFMQEFDSQEEAESMERAVKKLNDQIREKRNN